MADKKPTIKVKIPKVIPKKIDIKLSKVKKFDIKPTDLLSIDNQKELVNSWIKNKTLNNFIISKIEKEETEDNLRKLIGDIIDCEKYKDNECSIIDFSNENIILIGQNSGNSLIISFLDLIFLNRDYNKTEEVKKIRDKLIENGFEILTIEKLIKDTKMIDLSILQLKLILETLNDIYSFNFMVILENYYSKSGIISSIKDGQSLIGIKIENRNIFRIGFLNKETMKVEYLDDNIELGEEVKKMSIEVLKDEKSEVKTEVKKSKIPITIGSKTKEPKEIGEYISINPDDLLVKLPVVKINIEGIDYQFLMGKTGNIYTKTSDNILIGKVKGGELLLVEGYKEYL